MPFSIIFSVAAAVQLRRLGKDRGLAKRLKAVRKTIGPPGGRPSPIPRSRVIGSCRFPARTAKKSSSPTLSRTHRPRIASSGSMDRRKARSPSWGPSRGTLSVSSAGRRQSRQTGYATGRSRRASREGARGTRTPCRRRVGVGRRESTNQD